MRWTLFLLALYSFGQGVPFNANGMAHAQGGGAPTFIGSGGNVVGACIAAATSCSVTYSPSAGNALYVGIVYASAHVPTSVTDNGSSGGSSYAASTTASSVNGGNQFLIWYCTASTAASVSTVTVNGGGQSVMIMEFSGSGCSVDQANTTAKVVSSTSFSSNATSATTNAIDVALGLAYNVTTQNPTWTGTSGYTCLNGIYNGFTGNGNTMCYAILSSTGAQTLTGTVGSTNSIFSIIAVFH